MNIELHFEIKKQLALRGENLTSYSKKLGIHRQNLSGAALGRKDCRGPKHRRLINDVCEDLGIDLNKYPYSFSAISEESKGA